MTVYGDMLFEFGGVPVGGNRFTNPWNTHYFVDRTDGNDGHPGKTPGSAVETIQRAFDIATGGDVIYIRPGEYQHGQGFRRYTEDVIIACGGDGGSGNVATNANISLIGVSQRSGQATDFLGVRWKYATATPLTNRAPGTHIENIGFFAEDATYAINLENDPSGRTKASDGVSIYNCAIKG